MSLSAYYLVKSGKPLALVKEHIKHVQKAHQQGVALLKELGAEKGWPDRKDGRILAVAFKGGVGHPEFTKPGKNGSCYPKKGTEWSKRFKAQAGYPSITKIICETFNVPTFIEKKNGDFHHIGSPLNECGFLWISLEGPYCMWIPDVEHAVARFKSRSPLVGLAAEFKGVIPGAKRILEEEWELLVKQHEVDDLKKKAKK